jgi:hypothetical protein
LDEINAFVVSSQNAKGEGFVKDHVKKMLDVLYTRLWEEDNVCGLLESQHGFGDTTSWKCLLRQLYSQLQPKLLFGPLGERPLHLCSLSASRFEDITVRNGILAGMKDFIESDDDRAWKEAYVKYGKDYCAMIGRLLWPQKEERNICDKLPHLKEVPFFETLSSWKSQFAKSGHEDKDDKRILVTVGLYEGENLLFPLIASGDLETVQWLLNKEKKDEEDGKISNER